MDKKIDFSVVIPAYNEEKRLPRFLSDLVDHCRKSAYSYEIIVINDASRDKTSEVVGSFQPKFENLRLIASNKNRGKGHSVKKGMFAAAGDICLFMDADGSVPPDEIEKNAHYLLKDGYDIFVGSRVKRDGSRQLELKWHRKLIGHVFNFLVQSLLFKGIEDTQCGFKMFKRGAVEPLFSRSCVDGFGFDVEILFLAYKMGFKIKEGTVSWREAKGSKVNLIFDPVRMFLNVLQIRNWHCTPINVSSKYLGPDEYRYMYEMEKQHWWFTSREALVLKLVRSFGFLRPKILDAGSGTGGNLLELSKIGEAFGIDVSPKAIEFCERRGLSDVKECAVEKISYPDRTFDVITCLDLLEHVSEPVRALKELKRVLKDDGRIVITVPALKVLWSQHDEALCHLRRYDKRSLLRELEDAGLKVNKMSYFFFTSFFFVAPIRILRRFLVKKTKPSADTTTLPPGILNEFLKWLFAIEARIALRFGLPVGTTLFAVVSKS